MGAGAIAAILSFLGTMAGVWMRITSPEYKKSKVISKIDRELEQLRKERDEILKRTDNPQTDEQNAIDLGVVTNRIIFLRNKKRSIKG